MLRPHQRLHINDEKVAAKMFEGEAIIINLSTGVYYSMQNTGAAIWQLLQTGHSLKESAQIIARCYSIAQTQAASDVERLASQLVEEQLLLTADETTAPSEVDVQWASGQPYEAPVLDKYSDMKDLLALDPPMPQLKKVPWQDAPSSDDEPDQP